MTDPDLSTWHPSTEEADDTVTATAVAALHDLLDAPGDAPGPGEAVPPLWHWLAFLPRARQSQLGDDGHPKVGSFMPPVPPSRRMFAGGRLTFRAALIIGEPVHRTSNVTSVEHKSGRSGELVFVKIVHEYRAAGDDGTPSMLEEQDVVYRVITAGDSPTPTPANGGTAAGADGDDLEPIPDGKWEMTLPITPALLFRFSALTYNAHRIHYDRPYATQVEGYPGLIVHGPLQAIALAELARRNDVALATFQFRALQPAFDDGPLHLRGEIIDDHEVTLTAHHHYGQRTTQAAATFERRR